MNDDFEYDPIVVGDACASRTAPSASSRRSSTRDTPYIFNCKLFGTEGTIINNEVYSSKHYPGSLGYWTFPTIEPDSAEVEHHPFKEEIDHFMECIETDIESHASIHDTLEVDGGLLRDRRVGGEGRPAGQGAARGAGGA